MKPCLHFSGLAMMVRIAVCLVVFSSIGSRAATFSGNASIFANDSTNALSANPANNFLTVSCWFRIVVPTGTNITEDMVILMDRGDGNDAATFSYLLRFNAGTGVIEFLARGPSGGYTNTLIARPYLDRWYHVAVVRQNNLFFFYVDGRALSPDAALIGNAVGSGLSIGGISGNSRLFRGDIVEVAIYRAFLDADTVRQRMFRDQRAFANLVGYYKLAYSTNGAEYRNFVPAPPQGTDPATKQGAGAIEFEETDQAGEQSTFDSRKNHGQDAITPLSGAFTWMQSAFVRPVPGIPFDFGFGYSSATPTLPPTDGVIDPYNPRVLGPGWRQTFDIRLFTETSLTEFKLLTWDGAIEVWSRTNTDLSAPLRTRHNEYRGELVITNGGFEWTTPERLVYRFQDPTDGTLMAGRLREIRDFNGNRTQLFWNEDEGYVTNIVDTVGGRYTFAYDTAQKLLTNVAFGSWALSFQYESNRLVGKSLTNTSGLYSTASNTWRFSYNPSNTLLQSIVDPRGNTNTFVLYDKYGRKTHEVDALGRTNETRYGVPGKRQMTHVDPVGQKWIEGFDRKGHLILNQDPLTNVTSYIYDTNGNRTSITEPLGWTTFFGYDERANMIARTNALKQITRWNFHPFFNKTTNEVTPLGWTNRYAIDDRSGNLTNHSDDLGTLVRYTYWSNGLLRTSTDGNTNTTTFGYNTNGFLTTRTDPATNTTTFEYNDLGWKTSEMDALYNWTDYEYDQHGNVVQITDPLFRRFFRNYDGNGNLIAASDGKGRFSTNIYDAANQKVATIDRMGTNVTLFAYTPRGKLDRTTNAFPFLYVTRYVYDAANRLTHVTNALNEVVGTEYDANGNEIAMIDKVGQRWSKAFDELNRVTGESDPLGNTKQTSYDEAGRVKEIRTPNGFPSLHFYDGRGRLTNWIDAEHFSWKYTYDGNANITDIEDARHGRYTMGYSNRNERIFEKNQDGNTWRYTYDELLRLSEQRDPNNVTRTVQYDDAGRVDEVHFSTGRKHSFVYDDNNNVELVTRRDSATSPPVPTRFMYDVLDRPFEQSDVHRQTVLYGYDPLGRITSKTYPGGKILTQEFDAVGRLTNQVFDFGARQFTNAYAYDKAGRLVQHTYPNGIVQSNSFDIAGRITGLSHGAAPVQGSSNSPVSIALTYAYDRNGNKVGGSEKGTLEWRLPALTDETGNFTGAGKLIDSTITTLSTNNAAQTVTNGFRYDPSGNLTNWSGNGQSYSLAYDEDNRTTRIIFSSAATNVIISNRYDALGRRVARTMSTAAGSAETRFVLDLSGDMERILCDLDTNGVASAWYVHGPDLAFKVDINGDIVCYHADAQANVIALSDTNGAAVAQYAYSPYGRVLGSTNQVTGMSNPFLFVGSQGVMEELPGLYFMRARYYSAEAGVFLSTEPLRKIGPGWKPNLFLYGINNPSRGIDPDGRSFISFLSSAWNSVQSVVTSIYNAATQVFTGAVKPSSGSSSGQGTATTTTQSSLGGAKIPSGSVQNSPTTTSGSSRSSTTVPNTAAVGSAGNTSPNQKMPAKAFSSFDITKAVETATKQANNPSSIRLCGQYVRQAVEAGLGEDTNIHWAENAEDFGPYLEERGFKIVPDQTYVPRAGDVAVIAGVPSVPEGHVQLYSGTRWISNVLQADGKSAVDPYIQSRIGREDYVVYRFQRPSLFSRFKSYLGDLFH